MAERRAAVSVLTDREVVFAERDVLPALPRGTGLWKMPRRTHVVHHHLAATELALFDTDAAMRDTP